MSDGLEALPASHFQPGDPGGSPGPARGVLVAVAAAVPLWVLVGVVAWRLLG